jgi:N-formylglutamate deformylase
MNPHDAASTGGDVDHEVYTLRRGRTPLLISIPHVGRLIPTELQPLYDPRALDVEDTDWLLDEVYAFASELGAGLLTARHSRYVIDLNRPEVDAPMYPGVNNTELCPTRFFTGEPLYRAGCAPDAEQIAARVARYWRPYHDALTAELARLRSTHGCALLWEAHSIKTELPWLFEGRLPALNMGTVDGRSCDPALRDRLVDVLSDQSEFSYVVDGRFKGGYITRQHGRPELGVHVVQMEKCWDTYMQEQAPFRVDPARLARLQPLLRRMLGAMLEWGTS